MKSLIVFARIFIVGCLWCIVFTEGIRVIMLCNWHFDIFWPDHWRQLWTLLKAGWSPHAAKEWAFFILLITFFPMLITGWWTLCLIAWEDIIYQIISLPVVLYRRFVKKPINVLTTNNPYGVVKRKSYKQVRPTGVGSRIQTPISDYGTAAAAAPVSFASGYPAQTATSAYSSTSSKVQNKNKKTDIPATIDHALFKFDDDDDDFDLDIDSFEKTDLTKIDASAGRNAKKSKESASTSGRFENDFDDDFDDAKSSHSDRDSRNRRDSENTGVKGQKRDDSRRKNDRDHAETREEGTKFGPVYDILQQKNYAIISNTSVGGTVIDFIGVSKNSICLCLVDKEVGDWLADEEMFNGEDPLWFSESSHRVSPVCKMKNAVNAIKDKLDDEGFDQAVHSYVVIQMANIINADDMFEVWEGLDIDVTRVNRGAPKEIRLFSKTLEDAGEKMQKREFERLQKVLKELH